MATSRKHPEIQRLSARGWRSELIVSVLAGALGMGCGSDTSPAADATDSGGHGDAGGDTVTPPPPVQVATSSVESLPCTACGGTCTKERLQYPSRSHVGEVVYEDSPAVGGDHLSCWLPWAVYTSPVAEGRWVHNLEHGGIVVLYNCPDGCEADLAEARAFVEAGPDRMMAPEPTLEGRFAVLAWEHRLVLPCWETSAAADFYAAHADQAPESTTAAPPTSCPPP